jgi:hypothetical protein
MGQGKRDASELAAAVDAGIRKGLDLVDAFRGTPAGRRELERESKKSATDTRRARRAYNARKVQSQVMTIGGTAVGASAATVGVIDVAATGPGGVLWFGIAAMGAVAATIGGRSWRRLAPFSGTPAIPSPPVLVRRGAIGYESVARYTAVRVQTVQVVRAVEPLHSDAAREIRSADAQVAPTLNDLADRLRVLDEMMRQMPGTWAAENAQQAARAVSEQLDRGSAAYDVLLAASARLLAEPDLGRPVNEVLEPAASALVAYAHGLRKASEI